MAARRGGAAAGEHDRRRGRHRRLPAGLDHDRLVRLDDEGRAGDRVARLQVFAQEDACPLPGALSIDAGAGMRLRLVAGERLFRLGEVGAAADRLHLEALDHDRLVFEDEAELLAVRRLEGMRSW